MLKDSLPGFYLHRAKASQPTHQPQHPTIQPHQHLTSYFRAMPRRIWTASSLVGSGTDTGWKRRSKASPKTANIGLGEFMENTDDLGKNWKMFDFVCWIFLMFLVSKHRAKLKKRLVCWCVLFGFCWSPFFVPDFRRLSFCLLFVLCSFFVDPT